MNKMDEVFASVGWTASDIHELRPDWTQEQSEAFLLRNENNIRDRMVERGWAAIETLLEMEEHNA